MPRGADDCPGAAELEAIACGESADPRLAVHVAQCAACRAALDTVRENNALLAQIAQSRGALAPPGAAGAAPAIPGYEILGELHRGGQGVVYRARQAATHRPAAVKILLAGAFATSRQRRRFEREVELVAGLRHPGIVTVYDSGHMADGGMWLAMEYLEGRTLDDFVRDEAAAGRLGLRARLRLMARVCAAVAHAHQRGIIHRDLKPANVIVDASGEPRVLDFGLARAADPVVSGNQATVTSAGSFLGTLAYASPEQAAGDPAQVDVRSDVYALGVMLYETLTGTLPYPVTGRLSDVIDSICTAPPRAPEAGAGLAQRLDRDVETILLTALAKDPARRYESADALRRDLEHYLANEPIDARRDSPLYVLRKMLARHRLAAAAVLAGVLLLAAFGAAMSVLYRRAASEAAKLAQINVFLEDTLGSVESPRGGEVTVRDFLDEGQYWVDVALSDTPDVEAAVRAIIGSAYRNIGRLGEAERQLAASLATRRRLFGDRHLDVARSLSALGLLRLAQGRLDEAQSQFVEALTIRRDLLGATDLQTALAMGNVAMVLEAKGDLAAAQRVLAEQLAIRRAVLGDGHPDTAMSRFGLARLAEAAGSPEEAVVLHRRALEARLATLHPDHPDIARSQTALAILLMKLGRPGEAEPLLQACLARHERVLAEGHWRTAEVRGILDECRAAAPRP
jgi:tetratricopeptide (TPR) repeat protein/predicted Ser/Thr protein kinase